MKKLYRFTTSTCGVCRMNRPLWEKTVKFLNGKADIKEFILDKDSPAHNFVKDLKITQVPTVVVLDQNEDIVLFRKTGALSLEDINSIKKLIES